MKRHSFNYLGSVCFIILILVSSSCEKDPVFEQGDYFFYKYPFPNFEKVEVVNGIIFRWNNKMEITDEQKTVVREIITNLVKVEKGTFWMGAQSSNSNETQYDPAAQSNEKPIHSVTLNDYYIGKYEITQREWRVIMGEEKNWSSNYGLGDSIPAYNISWDDAQKFMEILSSMTNLAFSLPTEAQWEFAARGGGKSKHYLYSGDDDANVVAWHLNNSNGVLHTIGEKKNNELGLYDMSGGLWEWCKDAYHSYSSSSVTDPFYNNGSYGSYYKVLRGGSWTYLPTFCRSTARMSYDATSQSVATGFRVAISVQGYFM